MPLTYQQAVPRASQHPLISPSVFPECVCTITAGGDLGRVSGGEDGDQNVQDKGLRAGNRKQQQQNNKAAVNEQHGGAT